MDLNCRTFRLTAKPVAFTQMARSNLNFKIFGCGTSTTRISLTQTSKRDFLSLNRPILLEQKEGGTILLPSRSTVQLKLCVSG